MGVWEVLAILAVLVLTRGEMPVWPSTPVIHDGPEDGTG